MLLVSLEAATVGSSKPDLCELLRCVLSGGSLTEAAKRAGIDLNELMACLDRTC